jgi:hypothetical protein
MFLAVETSHAYPHGIEALVFPLPKRQEQSPRNDTASLVSSATTWAAHTTSLSFSSKVIQQSRTLDLPSDIESIVVTTSTPWSYYSGRLPPDSATPSRTNTISASSQSAIFVTSPTSYPSTTGEQLSSSSSPKSYPSQQFSSPSRAALTTSSNSAAVQESLVSRSSTPSNPEPSERDQILSSSAVSARASSQIVAPQQTSHSPLASSSSARREDTKSVPTFANVASKSESHIDATSTDSVGLPATPVFVSSSLKVIMSSIHGLGTSPLASIASAGTPLFMPVASPTSQGGILQGLSSSPLPLGNDAMSTGSSSFAPPLVSSTASAVSNTTTGRLPPVAPSQKESPAYVGATETSALSSSSIVSYTRFVLPSAGAGILTISPSSTLSKPTLVVASSNGFIPTSESTKGNSSATSRSAVSTLLNAIPIGVFFPDVSGTGVTSRSSNVIRSSLVSSTGSLSSTFPTKTDIPGTLSVSMHSVSSTGSSMVTLLVPRSTSSFNNTKVQGASSSTVPEPSSVSNSQKTINPSLHAASIVTASNTTSVIASQALIQSASPYRGWNSSAQLDVATPTKLHSSTVSLTGVYASPEETRPQASQTLLVSGWSNLTVSNTVLNVPPVISSTPSTGSLGQTLSFEVSASSTLSKSRSYGGLRRTGTAAVSPTASVTGSATGLPPLTTSQTAGVAIAGTAGLLIAVVAAIYIARRYHAKRARHTSAESIYPKVAYLYDPSTDGRGGDGGSEEAFMSGGSSGMPLDERRSIASPRVPGYGQRYSTGMLPMRFSDPGNPFRDTEDSSRYSNDFIDNSVHTPTNTTPPFAGTTGGYSSVAQKTPTTADFPAAGAVHDITWPSLAPNPVMNDIRSPNRSSILGEIASMAYNPNVNSHTTTSRYQALSPYGLHSSHSLPCVRETTYTESIRDPFEHDLLLQVDTRTETPDFVTVYAPSTTSIQPAQKVLPIKVLSNNPWASSLLNPHTSQSTPRLNSWQADDTAISPVTTIVESERFSLAYDNRTSTTFIAPSQKQTDNTITPISPPLGAIHRGWDDIKRYSADKVVPTESNLSPPLGYKTSSPIKKKSLPQLRRKELASVSSRESILSHARLPLAVKIPFAHNKSSSAETPKMSQLMAKGRNDDNMKSQDSTFSHSVQSLASMMHHKKKDGDMEFSCAGVK